MNWIEKQVINLIIGGKKNGAEGGTPRRFRLLTPIACVRGAKGVTPRRFPLRTPIGCVRGGGGR